MSPARSGGVILGLAATFLLQSVLLEPASAAPYPEPGLDPATRQVAARPAVDPLQRAVRQRERALAALYEAADARAAEISREVERLRALGYVGDLDDLTHLLPMAGYRLSAGFGAEGPLWETVHTGIDMVAPLGTTLVAIGDATVSEVGDAGPYGLRTVLTLEDGTELWYCHQHQVSVAVGQSVGVGQPIGEVGSTGNSTAPHLHLEVRPGGGAPIDPYAWLQGLGLQP